MIGNDSGRVCVFEDEGVVAVVELALVALHAEALFVVVATTDFAVVANGRSVAGSILEYFYYNNFIQTYQTIK